LCGSITSGAAVATASTSEPDTDVECLTVPALPGDDLSGVEATHFLRRPLYPNEGWYEARTVRAVSAAAVTPGSAPWTLLVRFDGTVVVPSWTRKPRNGG